MRGKSFKNSQAISNKPGMVAHAYDASYSEAESGGWQVLKFASLSLARPCLGGDVARCLPSMCEVGSSVLQTGKNKQQKESKARGVRDMRIPSPQNPAFMICVTEMLMGYKWGALEFPAGTGGSCRCLKVRKVKGCHCARLCKPTAPWGVPGGQGQVPGQHSP